VWENAAPIRREFEDMYEQNIARYSNDLHRYNLMKEALLYGHRHTPTGPSIMRGGGEDDDDDEDHEDKMDVKSELPPPPPSRDGGAGGFTSING